MRRDFKGEREERRYFEALGPVLGWLAPALGAASSAVGLGKQLFGGGPEAPKQAAPPTPAPAAPSVSPSAPSVSPGDYKSQQEAHWQQLFAGLGQGLPGGQLPANITESIEKEASLL